MTIRTCSTSQNKRLSDLGESEMRERNIDPRQLKKSRELFLLVVLDVLSVLENASHGLDEWD